jgi:hypothetical protein
MRRKRKRKRKGKRKRKRKGMTNRRMQPKNIIFRDIVIISNFFQYHSPNFISTWEKNLSHY